MYRTYGGVGMEITKEGYDGGYVLKYFGHFFLQINFNLILLFFGCFWEYHNGFCHVNNKKEISSKKV